MNSGCSSWIKAFFPRALFHSLCFGLILSRQVKQYRRSAPPDAGGEAWGFSIRPLPSRIIPPRGIGLAASAAASIRLTAAWQSANVDFLSPQRRTPNARVAGPVLVTSTVGQGVTPAGRLPTVAAQRHALPVRSDFCQWKDFVVGIQSARDVIKDPAMRAVGYQDSLPIDAPNALVDINLPKPQPQGRDLLVQVQAISVNPVDTKVRRRAKPEPGEWKVLGYDAAGTVVAVGPEATLFKPGDTIFYAGDINRPGTNAELHLVDERIVGRKPKTLDWAQAAALSLTAITAWEALFDR